MTTGFASVRYRFMACKNLHKKGKERIYFKDTVLLHKMMSGADASRLPLSNHTLQNLINIGKRPFQVDICGTKLQVVKRRFWIVYLPIII